MTCDCSRSGAPGRNEGIELHVQKFMGMCFKLFEGLPRTFLLNKGLKTTKFIIASNVTQLSSLLFWTSVIVTSHLVAWISPKFSVKKIEPIRASDLLSSRAPRPMS